MTDSNGAVSNIETEKIIVATGASPIEPSDDLSAWFEGTHRQSGNTPLVNAVRWTGNPALIDAHEQLVLGNSLSWFGDSMRRDPSTRDALETFNTFCEPSAVQTMRSFEAMWRVSQPVSASQMGPKNLFTAHETLAAMFSEDRDSVPTAELPKRH